MCIALLDVCKAFIRVWIKGLLLHNMLEMVINGKLRWLLINLYSELKWKVRIGDAYSGEFELSQGQCVFRKGKWSMQFFEIFYRNLILKLIHSYRMYIVCF